MKKANKTIFISDTTDPVLSMSAECITEILNITNVGDKIVVICNSASGNNCVDYIAGTVKHITKSYIDLTLSYDNVFRVKRSAIHFIGRN